MKLVAKFGKLTSAKHVPAPKSQIKTSAQAFDWAAVKAIPVGDNGAIEWSKEGVELTDQEVAALRRAYGRATPNMTRAKNVKSGLMRGWTNSRMVLEYRRIPGHAYVSIATDAAILRPLLYPVGEGL
jgi:hypothetical protein